MEINERGERVTPTGFILPPPTPPRTVRLADGTTYECRFTFASLKRVKQKTGLGLSDFQKRSDDITAEIPTFIWAALLTDEDRERNPIESIAERLDVREDFLPLVQEIVSWMPSERPTAAAVVETAATPENSASNGAGPSHGSVSPLPPLSSMN